MGFQLIRSTSNRSSGFDRTHRRYDVEYIKQTLTLTIISKLLESPAHLESLAKSDSKEALGLLGQRALKDYKESKMSIISLHMLFFLLIRCSRVPGISGQVGATGAS